MSDANNSYDEAYYQSGDQRGTQYRNYLEQAPKNRTYFEIAETIATIFKPKRCLEIGCATGPIVHHLAHFGIEAHGIDVSEWAIKHRMHANVALGSVENIQFADNYFDLVYSCHALEHIPLPSKDQAFSEISRVCNGIQFHMMPILESGPYVGDRFGHLLNLRTDPTHSLLYSRSWWLSQFQALGWADLGVQLALIHDNTWFELSECQILLSRDPADASFLQSVAVHNHDVARALSLTLNGRPQPGLDVHVSRLLEANATPAQSDILSALAEANAVRAEIAALRNSTSWRITAPLRRAVTFLKHR